MSRRLGWMALLAVVGTLVAAPVFAQSYAVAAAPVCAQQVFAAPVVSYAPAVVAAPVVVQQQVVRQPRRQVVKTRTVVRTF